MGKFKIQTDLPGFSTDSIFRQKADSLIGCYERKTAKAEWRQSDRLRCHSNRVVNVWSQLPEGWVSMRSVVPSC